MKKIIGRNTRLINRAYWFVKYRWIAICGVIAISMIVKYILEIEINAVAIIAVAFVLILENIANLMMLNYIALIKNKDKQFKNIKRNINFQITFDLIALTALIHYSGGIENPFIVAYFFHMVIASILLSQKETIIHTTFALLSLVLITYLEYNQIIEHFCLCILREEYNVHELAFDKIFIFRTLIIFIFSSYILIFLTSAIGKRLRQQEENYTIAIIQLNKNDELKNEYILRLTHDIKGHTAAIQSLISVVNKGIFGKINEKNKEFVDKACKRTSLMVRFIKDLLKLTQMRLSDQFKSSYFLLKETLIKAIEDVEENAKLKSIKLEYSIDDDINEIEGDEFSIKEITSNLFLNAIKYTPNNGEIKLEAYSLNDFIKVEITDTGMGIPQEDLPRIFEEFFRARNVNKNKVEGTGIGLAIVKRIINRHGGEIWAESEIGKGTKFTYTLPKSLNISKKQLR